ncbi:hypothetical protein LQF12_04510 [Ruania suaedae]|uniref:hypothetical protein n=1 Tax=Ruania suaedae TaxID=2897774 RepID=UPI001E587E89|nr:hypothetical protein [Ruania suaedae]UFU03877.1 hypothetical protein LQF12_04510 [Ruania suaedae]
MPNPYAPPDPNAPPPPERQWPPRDPQRRQRGNRAGKGEGDGQQGQPDEPRKPTPEEARRAGTSVLKFGVPMFCGLLALQWPIPWQVAAPLFFLAGVALGVRSLLVHRRAGMTGRFTVFLAFGVAMAGMLTLSSLAPLAMWDAQVQRQQCLDSALTLSAEDRCEADFADALEERFGTGG